VYQAPKVFNVFPKRAFAAGEEESFHSLLSERVGTTSVAHRMRISPQAWIFLAVVTIAGILRPYVTFGSPAEEETNVDCRKQAWLLKNSFPRNWQK
jgi:hypothetical protein